MPLVNDAPAAPPVEKPNSVRIASPKYQGVTVDTRYVPSSEMLAYVEGSPWSVEYYSQVLTADSAVMGQNTELDPIYQQYQKIRKFELKVTSPLSFSQDTSDNTMLGTGSATVYPMLKPNVGDMFLADIGDGREGVFKITNSERKTIFKDTCHVIEYQLIAYSTKERIGDLNAKVIRTFEFVKDFMNYGQNPILFEEDAALLGKLTTAYRVLTARYFKSFFSNVFKTLLVPGQEVLLYDHNLVKFVMSIFTTYDAPELRQIKILNADDDDNLKATCLWDLLKERDAGLLRYSHRQFGLVSTKSFTKNPMLEGIYFSGISYVVYPADPELSIDYTLRDLSKTISEKKMVLTPALPETNPADIDVSAAPVGNPEGMVFDGLGEGIPLIKPMGMGDYYIFSQEFYDKAVTGQSRLELAVHEYLSGKAISNRVLDALCEDYPNWGALERFYYTPILLTLIKASIRSI
jgi:hypothetical protein